MAIDDFDTSCNRECCECHRHGFDEGDWQFVGYDDEAELYMCPDCQSIFYASGDDLQTRVDELNVHPTKSGDEMQSMYYCGNCGVPRFVHGVILESCPNCGDDETDLSLIEDVP